MDRFESSVRTNEYRTREAKPRIESTNGTSRYYEGRISYYLTHDKFDQFIREVNPADSYIKDFVIYDETIPKTMSEKIERLYLLEKINSMPNVNHIMIYISDDSLRLYNELMKRMKWRYKDITSMLLTINRNPSKIGTLRLDELQCRTNLRQDDLIWLPDNVIRSLKGKIPYDSDIEDTIKLKRFLVNYANGLEDRYYFQSLTDFDKMFIAYRDIKKSIKFAHDRTRFSQEFGHVVLNPSQTRYESNPYGTLVHKSGVCEGQARLYKAMLSNPYLDVDCRLITGSVPSGESHMWTGVVKNNELYQVCLTIGGMFGNVDRAGYKPNSSDVYSKTYPHAYLTPEDEVKIERHVRSLKK